MQGAPNKLVGEVPHDRKDNRVRQGDSRLGATRWEGEEDAGGEDEEKRSGV